MGAWSTEAKQRRCGSNNPNWRGGVMLPKYCPDCGKRISRNAVKCSACARRGNGGSWAEEKKQKIRGENNHSWKGGRIVNSMGYVQIYMPEHPNACGKNRAYVLEHRLVMEQYIGRYLRPEEVVHHIDGNKQNNCIENLLLFANSKAHFKFNHFGAKNFVCRHCGKSQIDKES